WLYGIAYRASLKSRRSLVRRKVREAAAPARPPEETRRGPLAELALAEAQSIVEEEVARLPGRLRAPLVLCCLEGLARDEAAQQLGWTVPQVKDRLEQARDRLRERLARRGITLSAAFLGLGLLTSPARAALAPALVAATTRAAHALFAGGGLAGLVSPSVRVLMEDVMRGLLLRKARVGLVALLVCLTLGFGGYDLALRSRAGDGPAPRPAPALAPVPVPPVAGPEPVALTAEALKKWGGADVVLVAKLTRVVKGPVGLSEPPVWSHTLTFDVVSALRGSGKKGEQVVAFHSAKQKGEPTFPDGKECLVALKRTRGGV